MALREADCQVKDLAFIGAHGSATKKGDRSELMSILDAMQSAEANIPVCGMKPYTGHMGAASDLAEIILGIKAVKEGLVPATLNFTETEKAFSGLNLSGLHQRCMGEVFLSLSYGMGGQSSAIVISAS